MAKNWKGVIEEILTHVAPTPFPVSFLDLPFAEALWPWVDVARKYLCCALSSNITTGQQRLHDLLPSQAISCLERSLLQRWSDLCTPTMLLELRIKSLAFSLTGSTPRERYLDFLDNAYLNREGLSAFFQEYQELARLVGVFLLFWVEQATELTHRLEQDSALLARAFNQGQPLGAVTSLDMDAGDTHHEGRAVAIIHFSCGKRIVYKPKNVQIAQTFNTLIDRVNSFGLTPSLKSYTVLSRRDAHGDYGWEEAVEHKPCEHLESVHRYFERAGMLLCLTYLLDGTDMHFENIIASGEFPVLIDLETFFHARLHNPGQQLAESTMQHSVLATGLLPFFVLGKTGEKGIDISGLGQTPIQPSRPQWKNIHTDEMELGDSSLPPARSTNQVIFANDAIQVADYVEQIVQGFCTLYDLISDKRSILENENWILRMKENPVRIVLRSTREYAYLLRNLYSPYVLLNPAKREKELELLALPFGREVAIPNSIVVEERNALLRGDIPCFNTFPFSADLLVKDKVVAANCLDQTASQNAVTRLKQMSAADRNLQGVFIRQSLRIKTSEVHEASSFSLVQMNTELLSQPAPSDLEILKQATQLAQQLRNQAFVSEDGSLGWINLEANLVTEQYQMQPISYNLYSGRIGIALFFAALGRISGQEDWCNEALLCIKPLRVAIEKGNGRHLIHACGIGGMSGVGSMIYGLLHIGKIGHFPELIEEAKKLAHSIEIRHIEEDVETDLIAGSAGLLLILLNFYKHNPDPKLRQLALACGAHLCNKAQDLGDGARGWKSRDTVPLLGFSHGTAGIAYALLKLSQLEEDPQFSSIAKGALLYERSQFCPEKKNWPRLSANKSTAMCTWCHGATGVGLARIASLPLLADPSLSVEIDIALETTLNHLDQGPLNLCCGPLGRLEFLREASYALGRGNLDSIIQRTLQAIYHATTRLKTSDTFHHPGFMQGSSGLGYTLLRQIDVERCLPQVLLLE